MAKRTKSRASRGAAKARSAAKSTRKPAKKAASRKSGGRTTGGTKAKRSAARKGAARKAAPKSSAKTKTRSSKPKTARRPTARQATKSSAPAERLRMAPDRLNRARRTLEETIPTPPSSLDLDRRASAARTGRAEIAESREDHATMTPAITGGDVDADVENAYFSGDEAPGGDNPTPDQDIVDDIGRALGVEYNDAEELRSTDKVEDRDKHRWELDPASSEDYKDRK